MCLSISDDTSRVSPSISAASSSVDTLIRDELRHATDQRSARPKGALRCSPINVNIAGLCHSLRLSELRRIKQLNEDHNCSASRGRH